MIWNSIFLKCINGIQGTNPAGQKWNWLLDAAVEIIKYKKITTDYAIYIKVLSDVKVSYFTVSTDDVLDTTDFKKKTELRRVLKETFEIKVQEESVYK